MISLVLVLAQAADPLPPPPPPDPGQPFQPAQPAQPAKPAQSAPPRPPPPAYRAAPPRATPQNPRPAPEPYVKPDRPSPPPLSHRGFQLGVRTGVALPAGRLSEGRAMAALAAAQLPLFVDVGAKVSRHLFIGGYASFALGGVSDRFERDCEDRGECNSRSAHLGAQLQWHFAPAERANPWIGYGIGYEWLWTNGYPESTYRGPEYGRFMAGVDFRLSHDFGFGPFVDATLARYTDRETPTTLAGEIDDTAIHSWVTVGVRFVLFP